MEVRVASAQGPQAALSSLGTSHTIRDLVCPCVNTPVHHASRFSSLAPPFPLHSCSLVPCFKNAHVGYCDIELVGLQENMRGRLARFIMFLEPRDQQHRPGQGTWAYLGRQFWDPKGRAGSGRSWAPCGQFPCPCEKECPWGGGLSRGPLNHQAPLSLF